MRFITKHIPFQMKVFAQETLRGGYNSASKKAFRWYQDALSGKKVEGIEQNRGFFKFGKIYIFNYKNPITKDTMDFYDTNPVVFSLGSTNTDKGKINIGINLNFIPYKYKVALMNDIFKKYKSFINEQQDKASNLPTKQRELPIIYDELKKTLGKKMMFAIRAYKQDKISNIYIISYEKWIDAMFLKIEDIEKTNINNVYNLYKKSLK